MPDPAFVDADRRSEEASATVVVVPRERFSCARASLDHLFKSTRTPFNLVYIDGNSPPPIAEHLADQARQKGFRLIRRSRYLTPNEARNIGWSSVTTKYVVFIDNDVFVEPGWLQSLVRCAEETGAWVVGPLYLEGDAASPLVHMAGGAAHFVERDGRRHFYEKHRFAKARLVDVRGRLRREPVETVEFHCVLVRSDVRRILGPLDEGLTANCEHIDLALTVREAGGSVYLEPQALVTYETAARFEKYDRTFFEQRWSDARTAASCSRFREKWNLAEDDPYTLSVPHWTRKHRRLCTTSRFPWTARRVYYRLRFHAVQAVRALLQHRRQGWPAG